jgi:hypothetical protein
MLNDERVALVTRVTRAAEMQVSKIKQRLAQPQPEFIERERDARLRAVLLKTVLELTALDALYDGGSPAWTDDDDVPTNIDERWSLRKSGSQCLSRQALRQQRVGQNCRRSRRARIVGRAGTLEHGVAAPGLRLRSRDLCLEGRVGDKVLHLGTTDPLGADISHWPMTALTAYFGGRSLEKVAKILSKK